MLRSIIAAAMIMLGALMWHPAVTQADDADDFQRIISEQVAAFYSDDGARAFSYATPLLQQMFATPDNFMTMVKKGYPQVYRHKSFKFAETFEDSAGRPAQKAIIVDEAGRVWSAVYTFEKQPDGTWKIGSCTIVQTQGADA